MKVIPSCIACDAEGVSNDEFGGCVEAENIQIVTLDFENIPVYSTAMKSITITNGTCTEESYEVHRDPTTNPLDAVFHFNKYSWSLVAKSSEVFQIRYNPPMPNERSVDYFAIVNRGRTILKIIARGTSIGPKVSVSNEEVTMFCLSNKTAKKRVKIINESDVEANFMFDIDEVQNSFKPDPIEGFIGPNSHLFIVLTFEPKFHGYHVSLLPCLIQYQAPILIRLYGYCGKQQDDKNDVVNSTLIYPSLEKNTFRVYMSDCSHVRKIEATEPCQRDPISLSNIYIDFGRFDFNPNGETSSSPRTTCFTNHAFSDMLVNWRDDVDGIFTLTPNSSRVKAGETCLIEVRFNPTEENTFYERQFQALVLYLENGTSVPIFDVPMIASLRVIGHTFPADSSTWIPQYDLPRSIIMPPCLPLNSIYTTFVIKKHGHLPIMYRFIPPSETCFTVKPMQGIIRKNFQVIVVGMFPKIHEKLLYERWSIRFNGNPNYETFIDFRGFADYPRLNFGDDIIEFPLTHPGCEQVKHVMMLNPTRHHINYKFVDLPAEFNVDVIEGTIYSNEILLHKWIFCPPNEGDYDFTIMCCYSKISSLTSEENETMYVELAVVGKSATGYLLALPSELNFAEQPYNEPRKLSFDLTNFGKVEIPYRLNVHNANWPYEEKNLKQQIEIKPILGNLSPGDNEKIDVTLVPCERGYHEVSIRYTIRKNFHSEDLPSASQPIEICRLKYFCHLPVMKIEDLLHNEANNKIGKYVLWRLLNINKLNEIMNDLQPGESDNSTMNLPPIIVQDDPSIIKLFISNPTIATVNWSLKQKKNCSCSKSSEKNRSNFNSSKYICPHKKMSSFLPESGILEAYGKSVVTMELRYEVLGENILKWDLEIGYDRHVYLWIKIICLSENDKMAFPLYGSLVELENIYIGDLDPINQICWIYNPTKNDISYKLDTKAFNEFNENYRLQIFECFNPCGIVKKLSYEPIILKFKPRQLGLFEVTVPLSIDNEITEIKIKGECVNDRSSTITRSAISHRDLYRINEVSVRFNTDNVNVSPMSFYSRTTRIIMIHNRLEHELVAYKWQKYEIPGILEIDLEPETGRIQPKSMQTFRLIVRSKGKSCKINADVTCEFINQSKKRAYERSVIMQESLNEQMKNYFTITEKGTTFPQPENVLLEEPKSFYKTLRVRCYVYSPMDEELKSQPKERLKNVPSMETFIEKSSMKFPISKEKLSIATFMLECMIWDILQSKNIYTRTKSSLKYSQIAMEPQERRKIQEASYVEPPSRMIEKILENMIFMIVHKEFALDTIHLTRNSDARQATYPKIWQQLPGQEGKLDQSPKTLRPL